MTTTNPTTTTTTTTDVTAVDVERAVDAATMSHMLDILYVMRASLAIANRAQHIAAAYQVAR